MAGVSITIDDRRMLDALNQLQRAAERPAGAMKTLGQHFVTSTQMNIEHETAPDGTPWPPLSPRTANRRVGGKRRGEHPMLRVSGRLYASISYLAEPDSVEWGSNVVYARIHQLGGVIDIPARTGKVSLKGLRRKGGGIRSRFVRPGTRGAREKSVSIRGHQVRIPARPYLGITAADRQAVPQIIADYLRAEVGA